MGLDMPAAGEALWAISDATGARPEYLLPVLANESGLDPSVANHAGAPYYGIGQNGTDAIAAAGTDPQTYLTWSASEQLSKVVGPYFQGIANRYGDFGSGLRVYQAEFLPGTLASVNSLSGVIASAPDATYEANKGFDTDNKGFITLGDLGAAVAHQAAQPYVQSAINAVYALRPFAIRHDSVYGTDFSTPGVSALKVIGSILVLTYVAHLVIQHGGISNSIRDLRRAL